MEHTARPAADGQVVLAAEIYYTVAEIAEMWKVSKDHARRIFDPGAAGAGLLRAPHIKQHDLGGSPIRDKNRQRHFANGHA